MFRTPSHPILSSLVAVTLLLSTAIPAYSQTSAGIAQARQHYENAVAAIAKKDWQTAKTELQQAEKLAPQNALVHYDLALAYSQSGQANSALTEVNKALQLGLPAAQKQAAKQLQQQVATETQGTEPRSNPQQKNTGSTATDSSLKYFLGRWSSPPVSSTPTGSGCTGQTSSQSHINVQPTDDPGRVSVKYSVVFSASVSNYPQCFINGPNGSRVAVLAHTEQYLGHIHKEGTELRLINDDGTCSGDCAGVDLTGHSFTLEIDSQDTLTQVSKVDNNKITFNRE